MPANGHGPMPRQLDDVQALERTTHDAVPAPLRRLVGRFDVRQDRVDHRVVELRRQIVSHPLDDEQLRARDRPGRRLSTADVDEGVAVAVDHERRHRDRTQGVGPIAGGEDRRRLACDAVRIMGTVVGLADSVALGLDVKGVGRAPDDLPDPDREVDRSGPVLRWRLQQGRHRLGRRLADTAIAGVRHDRAAS